MSKLAAPPSRHSTEVGERFSAWQARRFSGREASENFLTSPIGESTLRSHARQARNSFEPASRAIPQAHVASPVRRSLPSSSSSAGRRTTSGLMAIERANSGAAHPGRLRRRASQPRAAAPRARRLNCFHQIDDRAGANVPAATTRPHHWARLRTGRMLRRTANNAPAYNAMLTTVSHHAAFVTRRTRLSRAATTPRKGVLIQVLSASGWPVSHANRPAEKARPTS
jgi:hypothetical protein